MMVALPHRRCTCCLAEPLPTKAYYRQQCLEHILQVGLIDWTFVLKILEFFAIDLRNGGKSM